MVNNLKIHFLKQLILFNLNENYNHLLKFLSQIMVEITNLLFFLLINKVFQILFEFIQA